MTSSRHRLAIGACIAVTLGACSLFVDTSGLSGGAPSAGEGGIADASAEAAVDAAKPSDAGGDAAKDASVPFCDSHPGHTLCYDFDESNALPPADQTFFDPGGSIVVDGADHVSAPSSLLFTWPATMGVSEGIQKAFSGTGKITCDLDVKVTSTDLSNGQLSFLYLYVPTSADYSRNTFFVQVYHGDLDLSEGLDPADGGASMYTGQDYEPTIPNDTWQHISFVISGSDGAVSISLDGGTPATFTAFVPFDVGQVTLVLGGYGASLNTGAKARMDNLVCDF